MQENILYRGCRKLHNNLRTRFMTRSEQEHPYMEGKMNELKAPLEQALEEAVFSQGLTLKPRVYWEERQLRAARDDLLYGRKNTLISQLFDVGLTPDQAYVNHDAPTEAFSRESSLFRAGPKLTPCVVKYTLATTDHQPPYAAKINRLIAAGNIELETISIGEVDGHIPMMLVLLPVSQGVYAVEDVYAWQAPYQQVERAQNAFFAHAFTDAQTRAGSRTPKLTLPELVGSVKAYFTSLKENLDGGKHE